MTRRFKVVVEEKGVNDPENSVQNIGEWVGSHGAVGDDGAVVGDCVMNVLQRMTISEVLGEWIQRLVIKPSMTLT